MKILLVNKFFYKKGGSESYFFDLADILEKNGHEVIFFSMKDPKNKITKFNNYFVDSIDFNRDEGLFKNLKKVGHLIYSIEAQRKIQKLVKKYQPDIAHLHNISHQISPSILSVFKKYNIPVAQTLHDYELICPNYRLFVKGSVCERCKKHKYFNAVKNKCLKNSTAASLAVAAELAIHKVFGFYRYGVDKFITPSMFLKKKLVAWGQDENKIINLPNFINLDLYEPSYKSDDYILYSGRLAEEKGIMDLVQAMKEIPQIKLKIVGDGAMIQEIRKHISKNEIRNIELLGYKKFDELMDIISKAKFVILPSIWYENYSITLLEAAAMGKPAIASNLGGNSEIVKEGFTGLLFEAGNIDQLREKIKFLYGRGDLIVEMGKNARDRVEMENSAGQHYEKIMKVYEELV